MTSLAVSQGWAHSIPTSSALFFMLGRYLRDCRGLRQRMNARSACTSCRKTPWSAGGDTAFTGNALTNGRADNVTKGGGLHTPVRSVGRPYRTGRVALTSCALQTTRLTEREAERNMRPQEAHLAATTAPGPMQPVNEREINCESAQTIARRPPSRVTRSTLHRMQDRRSKTCPGRRLTRDALLTRGPT